MIKILPASFYFLTWLLESFRKWVEVAGIVFLLSSCAVDPSLTQTQSRRNSFGTLGRTSSQDAARVPRWFLTQPRMSHLATHELRCPVPLATF